MSKRTIRGNERVLADRLRREAEASRPAFSEELHERICLVTNQGDAPSRSETASPRPEIPSPRPDRRLWLTAAATLLLAGASLLAWQLNINSDTQVSNPNTPAPVTPNDDGPMDQDLAGFSEITDSTAAGALLVDSILTTEGWAYLDHDARVATELVLNQ